MAEPTELWIARHGETEWTISRKHTGRTDVPLTPRGEQQATALGARLRDMRFGLVLASPLARAMRTAELAGFADQVEEERDLMEVDYGEYEGRTTAEITRARPGWDLWRDGCPGGETVEDAAVRADRVLARVRGSELPVLLVGHGHMSRVLAARSIEYPPALGRHLGLDTAALCIIGSEHGEPSIRDWNDTHHLA